MPENFRQGHPRLEAVKKPAIGQFQRLSHVDPENPRRFGRFGEPNVGTRAVRRRFAVRQIHDADSVTLFD